MLTEEPSVAPTVLVSSTPRKAEATLAEQLRQLAALRDDGILTEDEFTAKKTQLLGL
nr:SHOCT domain-containing protein [Frigoribacterium endophyticum]